MMQVTVKTLRHYEQKGLLLPDEVDEWTGYRYYSLDQMQKLQSIRDLQRLGFSLDEIKDLYDDESRTPRHSVIWRSKATRLLGNTAPAILMEHGTRKTLKNGSQSFRFR
jgi:DNA-binding transcriptional MerR regulator